MPYRVVVAIVVCLVGVVAFPHPAEACSCVSRTPEQVLHDHAVVFRGQVTATALQGNGLLTTNLATFKVDEVWNGPVVQELIVLDKLHAATCSAPFVEGSTFTVIGIRVGNIVHLDSCAHTVLSWHNTSYAIPGQGTRVTADAPASLDAIIRAPVVATPGSVPSAVTAPVVTTDVPEVIPDTAAASVPPQEPTQLEPTHASAPDRSMVTWIVVIGSAATAIFTAALIALRRLRRT